jgi:biotin transport system substrate-specific component|tara:strand:- start:149 stop:754 length:606 start_codon:yes stop_codon:yes gene_type:complete
MISIGIKNSLVEEVFFKTDSFLMFRRLTLVVVGIFILALFSKIKIPIWPSPVPINLATLSVLTIGLTYGPKLGLTTVFGYLIIGTLGFDIFANSSAKVNGMEYMLGGTGGYLFGYLLATIALGFLARAGWDRNVFKIVLALIIGSVLIYIPGIFWLAKLYTWNKPILAWGLTPFLIGDALKILLATLVIPSIWKFIGSARK